MAAKVLYHEGLFFILNLRQNSLGLVRKESHTFKAQYALFYGWNSIIDLFILFCPSISRL